MPRLVLLLVIVALCSCGGQSVVVNTPEPRSTAEIVAAATPVVPTVTLAPSPTFVATAVVVSTTAPTTEREATPPPTDPPIMVPTFAPVEPTGPEEQWRTVRTADGFVAVRAQPSTASAIVGRIDGGTPVVCAGTVAGEAIIRDGVTSDRWAACPSVGGYIFAPLLEDPAPQSTATPQPVPTPRVVIALNQRYRTITTADGFVSVRAQPSTASREVRQLAPQTDVDCVGIVVGQTLIVNDLTTNQWIDCPSVGGYIFGALLVNGSAPAVVEPYVQP
jgi:hypothetical protein